MTYSVVLSARAERYLRDLLAEGADRYTPQQCIAYAEAIRARCRSLEEMPHRFPVQVIGGREFRRFNHKANAIFYRIIEDDGRVVIEAVLRGSRDFRRHL